MLLLEYLDYFGLFNIATYYEENELTANDCAGPTMVLVLYGKEILRSKSTFCFSAGLIVLWALINVTREKG